MRTLRDGSKLFSPSEQMPTDMKGYVQDTSNRLLWIPDPEPCVYRETRATLKPCGNYAINNYCVLKEENVSFGICSECDESTTPEESVNNDEQVVSEN